MFFLIWNTSKLWLCLLLLMAIKAVAADEDVVTNLRLAPAVDMIDASWELQNATGDVTRYHVTWVTTDGNTKDCYVSSNSSSTSDCEERPSLSSCTYYTVTVQPEKQETPAPEDTGTPASASIYTLPGDVPISSASCQSYDDMSITVTWDGPGQCVQYTVSYNGTVLWEYYPEYRLYSLTTHEMTATFTDLVPYTRYDVTVVGLGVDGKASCTATTPQSIPSAPTYVTARALNSTTVQVDWSSPSEENGIILQYTVRWRLATDTEEDGVVQVPEYPTSYDVPDLQECLLYLFSVSAHTIAGEGPEASIEGSAMKTEPEAPEVVCKDSNRISDVVWTTPTTSCPIDGYDIHYTVNVIWSDEKDDQWVSVAASESYFELEHTTPYSYYDYEVMAVVASDLRGPAGTCTVMTNEAAPSAPQDLSLLKATSNSLYIKWEQPVELNGNIEWYSIACSKQPSGSSSSYKLYTTSGQSLYTYTINYLDADSDYEVKVKAYTVTYGDPATEIFATISSGAPPMTSFTTLAPSSSDSSNSVTLVVICSLFGIILIVALILTIVYKKSIRQKFSSVQNHSSHARSPPPANTNTSSLDALATPAPPLTMSPQPSYSVEAHL